MTPDRPSPAPSPAPAPAAPPQLDRRSALVRLAAGGATCVLAGVGVGVVPDARADERQGPAGAAADDPRAAIVDCHTHFFDPTRPQGVPWPGRDSSLYRRTLPADYRRQPTAHPVTGTIVVEASPWVEDNQWVLDLARDDRFILGLIGNLAPGRDEFAGQLARFAKNPLFRGLRASGKAIEEGVERPEFLADLGRMSDAGLTLDVNGGPALLDSMARLARRLPDLTVVVNHLGGVRIDGREPAEEWRRGIEALAARPNVFLKVSGHVDNTGLNERRAPRELDFYRPVLDFVWTAFGEDRLIYGSNWPVSDLYADLATVQRLIDDYFSAKGPGPLRKLFAANSQRAYRWRPRT